MNRQQIRAAWRAALLTSLTDQYPILSRRHRRRLSRIATNAHWRQVKGLPPLVQHAENYATIQGGERSEL